LAVPPLSDEIAAVDLKGVIPKAFKNQLNHNLISP
jgi:hypothetical protein